MSTALVGLAALAVLVVGYVWLLGSIRIVLRVIDKYDNAEDFLEAAAILITVITILFLLAWILGYVVVDVNTFVSEVNKLLQ